MRALRPSLIAASAAALLASAVFALPDAGAATGDGSPTDPNVTFVGRWDTTNPAAYVPYWAGAYLTTGFTGTTVRLRQRSTIDLYYSIDGRTDAFLTNVSGTVNLTPTPLAAGNHTLRVSYRVVAGSYHGDAVFQGLTLDSGARTYQAGFAAKLIEFVGDSITVGTTSSKNALTAYGWLIGERLGTRHTQIAQGGACLVATADGCVGLESQFGKLNPNAPTPNWDFSRYQANAVVINLGTNDVGHGVSTTQFQTSYINLLRQVRAKYPAAAIFALETFTRRYAAQTLAAVQTLTSGGDRNVFSVNTEGWLTSADLSDSVHPNDTGHRVIADHLAPIISARLGGTAPPSPSPSSARPPSPSAAPTGSAGCTVRYAITSQWQGGFQGDVTITSTAGSPVNGWTLRWTFPDGQTISQAWNAGYTQTGAAVAITDAGWNAAIAPGTAASFGFLANQPGTNNRPATFTLNTTTCAVA
ncbi:MAG: hypothetical protein V7603_6453 [Micromonosporaceae bacterium]